MKKESILKIEEEINKKTTLPSELKDNIRKDIFTNIVIAIIMITYFTTLIMGSVGANKTVRVIDFNIFSIILLSVGIYLFEVAYKKDSGTLAIFGIEALSSAIFTLFLPYIIFELDDFRKRYYMIISLYISIYYIIKSIYIYTKHKKTYAKQVSDIKDIVKKEKIKKDSKVDTKKADSNNQKIENKNTEKSIDKNEHDKKETTTKTERTNKIKETTKITGTTKKEQKKEDIKTEIAPKKRGRPKKEDTLKKEQASKVEESTPKKRGRPRKVVTK